jgi:hypothetical protein
LASTPRRSNSARVSPVNGSDTTSSLYGSNFSSSATIAWNTHGDIQLDSAYSVSCGATSDISAAMARR